MECNSRVEALKYGISLGKGGFVQKMDQFYSLQLWLQSGHGSCSAVMTITVIAGQKGLIIKMKFWLNGTNIPLHTLAYLVVLGQISVMKK